MARFVKPARVPWLLEAVAGSEPLGTPKKQPMRRKTLDLDRLNVIVSKPYREVDVAEIATMVGVPHGTMMAYLKGEIEREAHCLTLPSTIMLVVLFACAVLNHFEMGLIKSVEDSIDVDIIENANFAFSGPPDKQGYFGHKNIHDVHSRADFWSWFRLGFVPLIFHSNAGVSEGREYLNVTMNSSITVPPDPRGFYLTYSRIIGGLRVSQERSKAIVCNRGAEEARKYFQMGFPPEEKRCVGGADLYESGVGDGIEMPGAVRRNNPMMTRWLLYNQSALEMDQIVLAWEADPDFLNRETMKLELSFVSFNGEIGKYVVTYVVFHFSRGGFIWKRVSTVALSSTKYPYIENAIYDILFVGLMAHVALKELRDIIPILVKTRGRGLSGYCKDPWNIVDWVSIIFSGVIVALWVTCLLHTNEINRGVGQLADMDLHDPQYIVELSALYDNFDEAVSLEKTDFKQYVAIFPLVIMLRLFKAFAAQPRLAVVTRTLVLAFTDLYHFMIVFATIFVSYAIMGTILFGQDLQEFSDLSRSFMTCFRVMLGDFDWISLSDEVGRMQAGVWFVTFVVIIVLLLLNMLLAILMETYSVVKESNRNAQTLMDQLFTTGRRAWMNWRKERVSLNKIVAGLQQVDGLNPAQIITMPHMLQSVEGLREEQALRLMSMSILDEYYHDPCTLDELLMIGQKLDHRLKKLTSWLRPIAVQAGLPVEPKEYTVQAPRNITSDSLPPLGQPPSHEEPSVRGTSIGEEAAAKLESLRTEVGRLDERFDCMHREVVTLADRVDMLIQLLSSHRCEM